MLNIKNLFYTVLLLVLVVSANSADAVVEMNGGGGGSGGTTIRLPNPLKASNFNQLLESVLNLLLVFAIPLYALMVVIAGYYFLFGGQNPANRVKSLTIFKYATIGLVFLLFSRAIVALIQGSL
ncbi:MAG: hypothetical protein WD712_01345 [Candidatus Spechtbacterales bacterium]